MYLFTHALAIVLFECIILIHLKTLDPLRLASVLYFYSVTYCLSIYYIKTYACVKLTETCHSTCISLLFS